MKQIFNVTIAVAAESEKEIENLMDIVFDVDVRSSEAALKVLEILETFEVSC